MQRLRERCVAIELLNGAVHINPPRVHAGSSKQHERGENWHGPFDPFHRRILGRSPENTGNRIIADALRRPTVRYAVFNVIHVNSANTFCRIT